ncbi:NADPH-dependent 2,4-dienoyl-CoA reductase/sulfur reductase-like enzyme [Rhizobium tibeticum]|uniref:(2Fe-2S)-binding protein n=1 Tax=Rhizobium tibeticum TaxID=501024 RepID=UPI002787FDEA|nr:(2Fe-2S)-binding protein [Rhizobium tibeticum]MDP9810368.1 NADPH-dependent 2,4-dienoyl-CoA reductase/sulfur reductase-like enzyme [Rhizobium tibeticum]
MTDGDGRSSVEGIYLAGDGLAIRGSEVAAMTGELAAMAILADAGRADASRAARLRRGIERMDRFRRSLNVVFPFPRQLAADLPNETVICRCEGLTAHTLRDAVAASAECDINRIKAFTRLGMGRCQGRICGLAAAELIAAKGSVHISEVGRLRGQAPIKPLMLSTLAGGAHDGL